MSIIDLDQKAPHPNQPPPVVSNWNRLEGRPRGNDIAQALRTEVHDGLWFLTRQWQMGEFKGEDTGTAIMAKIEVENSTLNRFAPLQRDATPYDDSLPLEARVERSIINIDLALSIRMGQQLLKLIDHYGQQYQDLVSGTMQPYSNGMYGALFTAAFSLSVPEPPALGQDELVEKAALFSNVRRWQMLEAASGRAMNGAAFWEAMHNTGFTAQGVQAAVSTGEADMIHTDHYALVETAVEAFAVWFRKLYCQPDAPDETSWNDQQLEYQFSCTVPDNGNVSTKSVAAAEEYYSGHLDWYSFDWDKTGQHDASLTNTNSAVNEGVKSTKITSMIPTGVRFSGMPNTRWWEFEDREVDFANIDANVNETAKILLAEFALVHSSNWSVIPYTIPVGSVSEVKSIVVTDVFGKHTLIEPAGAGLDQTWERWNMYNLNTRVANGIAQESDHLSDNRLFIPPILGPIHESKPIESVNFLRDEMANMVWAVENIVADALGAGMDGKVAAEKLAAYLAEVLGTDDTGGINENDAALRYLLMTSVPEHWIPLIPVKVPGSLREIQLQRGAMPRFVDGVPATQLPVVEARTHVLSQHEGPYYINEEEVPRAGAVVNETWQRARWYDGKIILWKGKRKVTGRGEGASKLVFDQVDYKPGIADPF